MMRIAATSMLATIACTYSLEKQAGNVSSLDPTGATAFAGDAVIVGVSAPASQWNISRFSASLVDMDTFETLQKVDIGAAGNTSMLITKAGTANFRIDYDGALVCSSPRLTVRPGIFLQALSQHTLLHSHVA